MLRHATGVPKEFLQPEMIGIIPAGGYTNKKGQSKKAIMWLTDEEQRDGKRILHGRNGREYVLPELPELRGGGLGTWIGA